jgi:hypothetical protein
MKLSEVTRRDICFKIWIELDSPMDLSDLHSDPELKADIKAITAKSTKRQPKIDDFVERGVATIKKAMARHNLSNIHAERRSLITRPSIKFEFYVDDCEDDEFTRLLRELETMHPMLKARGTYSDLGMLRNAS